MTRTVKVVERVSVRASQTNGRSYAEGTHEVPDDVAADLLSHRAVIPADTDSGADFDAAAFVDRHHATVRSDITDGQADGHLDAVRDAEQSRDSPRNSVLQAIDDRRAG